MPDLTQGPDSYIAANYRRATTKFSNYGTRRLRFYTIGVQLDNYDPWSAFLDYVIGGNNNATENNFGTQGWDGSLTLNPPKSIIESVLRGVSLIAETYYVSQWSSEETDPDVYWFTVTVAVAYDTVVDAMHPDFTENGIGFTDAIGNALGDDFPWDYVEVWPVEIYGENLQYDQMQPPISLGKSPAMSDANKAAKQARSGNQNISRLSRTQ